MQDNQPIPIPNRPSAGEISATIDALIAEEKRFVSFSEAADQSYSIFAPGHGLGLHAGDTEADYTLRRIVQLSLHVDWKRDTEKCQWLYEAIKASPLYGPMLLSPACANPDTNPRLTWGEVYASILKDDRVYPRRSGRPEPFTWNVKAYPETTHPCGEYTLNPLLDELWDQEVQSSHSPVDLAYEDARRDVTELCFLLDERLENNVVSAYFVGRSGGYVALELSGFGASPDAEGKLCSVVGQTKEFLLSTYVTLLCADAQLTPESAEQNVEYHLNFHRHSWETDNFDELLNYLIEEGHACRLQDGQRGST